MKEERINIWTTRKISEYMLKFNSELFLSTYFSNNTLELILIPFLLSGLRIQEVYAYRTLLI